MTPSEDVVASQLREAAAGADIVVRPVALEAVRLEIRLRSRRRRHRLQGAAALAVAAAVAAVFLVPLPSVSLKRHASTPTSLPHRIHHHSTLGVSVARLEAGRWSTIPAAPVAPRTGEVVVWTGRELIVWGGSGLSAHGSLIYGDGAAYDPATRRWRLLRAAPLPPTTEASAVWTGREMVVFGGYVDVSPGAMQLTNAAAAFDPVTNRWRLLPTPPVSPRASAIALWTGKVVVVLGGGGNASDANGATFDPLTNKWQSIAAPTRANGHSISWQVAVRVGDEVLGFSTWSQRRRINKDTFSSSGGSDLFALDLATWRWRLVPPAAGAVPSPEEALSTGHDVIVRGGAYNCGDCPGPFEPAVSALYDPVTNTWTRVAPDPLGLSNTTSAWTGHALFSFDDETEIGSIRPGSASIYDPSAGVWHLVARAPFGCNFGQPLVWTGRQVLAYCPTFGAGTRPSGLEFTPGGSS